MLIKPLSTFILLCFITACSHDIEQPFTLDYLYHADPAADAEKALAKGDSSVYGVYGYSLTTPDIKRECVDEQNIIPIEGTSHSYTTYKEAQFNTLARLYAGYYNSQVKSVLIYNGNTCLDAPQKS